MKKTRKELEREIGWRLASVGFFSAAMLHSGIIAATTSSLWISLLALSTFGITTVMVVANIYLLVAPE